MAPIKRTWTNKDGTTQTVWTVNFTFKRPDGKTVRVREKSPVNTKAGAIEFERQKREQLLNPSAEPIEPPRSKTLNDFLKDFLAFSKNNNKASTYYSKESILDLRIKPAFGALPLDQITVQTVEAFKTKMRDEEQRSTKTINNYLIVLKKLLNLAVEYGVLVKAPKIKMFPKLDTDFEFLYFDEAERFLTATPPEWYAMLYTALRTGLRLGELIELKWSDIDLTAGRLAVKRNIWRGEVGAPKGGRARFVDLSDETVKVLKAHRHLKGDYVFCEADGKQFSHDHQGLKDIVPFICKKAGLGKRLTMHDLRHTCASHLVMRGAPLVVVQQLLGHADITTTMRYAHLSPAAKKEWVNALDATSPVSKKGEGQS